MKPVYLLTGQPGTGKTSLIKQAVSGTNIRASGFYTEEIRQNGIRQGFRLVTLDGESTILSHVDIRTPQRVSKYGVDIEALDKVGITALNHALCQADLIVIDEIGRMELFSENFKTITLRIIESGKRVLGTIMLSHDKWADMIKKNPNVNLITLTRENRQQVLTEIIEWLKR